VVGIDRYSEQLEEDLGVAEDIVEHPEKPEVDLVVVVDTGLNLPMREVERLDIDPETAVDDFVAQDVQSLSLLGRV
jgi:hypothetical protein